MTNEKVNDLLRIIHSFGVNGDYTILQRKEIEEKMPEGYTSREMDNALMELQALDYIALRYSDSDVLCLAILPKGILKSEKLEEIEEKRKQEAERAVQEKNQHINKKQAEQMILSETETPDTKVITTVMRVPWKKIIFSCFMASLLGGTIAGVIVALITKLF